MKISFVTIFLVFYSSILVFGFENKIIPSDSNLNDKFGQSVAIEGNYALVSSNYDFDNSLSNPFGAVYCYKKVDNSWVQTQKIVNKFDSTFSQIGREIKINGNRAFITQNNYPLNDTKILIYEKNGEQWLYQNSINLLSFNGEFDVSGDYLVSFPYVYHKIGNNWVIEDSISVSDSTSYLGSNGISIDGDFLAIADYGNPTNQYANPMGAIYLFKRNGTNWAQHQKISQGVNGGGWFGIRLDLENNILSTVSKQKIYIFEKNNNFWVETFSISKNDGYTEETKISNNRVAFTRNRQNSFYDFYDRTVDIYEKRNNSWVFVSSLHPNTQFQTSFGKTLDFSGNNIIAGDYYSWDKNYNPNGLAYIYDVIPEIAVNPNYYNFNSINKGSSRSIDVKIINNFLSPMTIEDYEYSNSNFSGTPPSSIAIGDTANFKITCHPDEFGKLEGNLLIKNSSGVDFYVEFEVNSIGILDNKVYSTNPIHDEFFGNNFDIDDNFAIVGNQGKFQNKKNVYLYQKENNSWNFLQHLTPIDTAFTAFGNDVSIYGDFAIAATKYGPEKAYIFHNNGTEWVEFQELVPNATNPSNFGASIELNENYLLIGAPLDEENGNNAGAIYTYQKIGNSWVFTQKILGNSITDKYFGRNISLFGDNALFGTKFYFFNGVNWIEEYDFGIYPSSSSSQESYYYNNHIILKSGIYVKIYKKISQNWVLEKQLLPFDRNLGNEFKGAVAINDSFAIVGSFENNNENGRDSGAIYLYKKTEDDWVHYAKYIPNDGKSFDRFGMFLTIDKDNFMVGSPFADDFGSSSGSVYIFDLPKVSIDKSIIDFGEVVVNSSQTQKLTITNNSNSPLDFTSFLTSSETFNAENNFAGNDNVFTKSANVSFSPIVTGFHSDYLILKSNSGYSFLSFLEGVGLNNYPTFPESILHPEFTDCSLSFGKSVAIDSTKAIIGSSNKAFIYENTEFGWERIKEITHQTSNSINEFSSTVDISQNHAIVGNYSDDENGTMSGSVFIYKNYPSGWGSQLKITPSDVQTYLKFGYSVSIENNILAIGAIGDNGSRGAVYVYEEINNQWVLTDKIFPDNNASLFENFGYSVKVSQNKIFVGCINDDSNGQNSGAVYIFEKIGNSWVKESKIFPQSLSANDNFGSSISVHNNKLIVSAINDDEIWQNSGAVYIFEKISSNWLQSQKLIPNSGGTEQNYGKSINIYENKIVIGAPNSQINNQELGKVCLYTFDGTEWNQEMVFTSDSIQANNLYGFAVSLYDNELFIGSPNESILYSESGSVHRLSLQNFVKIENRPIKYLPNKPSLSQNYPNPFNPTTKIKFGIPEKAFTKLEIFNVLGQRVKTLVNSELEPNFYEFQWNGTNNSGKSVSSGVYFYRLEAGNFVETRKMLFLK